MSQEDNLRNRRPAASEFNRKPKTLCCEYFFTTSSKLIQERMLSDAFFSEKEKLGKFNTGQDWEGARLVSRIPEMAALLRQKSRQQQQ